MPEPIATEKPDQLITTLMQHPTSHTVILAAIFYFVQFFSQQNSATAAELVKLHDQILQMSRELAEIRGALNLPHRGGFGSGVDASPADRETNIAHGPDPRQPGPVPGAAPSEAPHSKAPGGTGTRLGCDLAKAPGSISRWKIGRAHV